MIQVYKVLNHIDHVNIDKFFIMSELSTRGKGNQDNFLTEQFVETFFETTRRQIVKQLVDTFVQS